MNARPLISALRRVKGMAAGAVDHVPVPMLPQFLRARIGVLGSLHRKADELEILNRRLEARVSERTGELDAVTGQLREREHRLRLQSEALAQTDRRRTEFLAMLAHELRNPLQPIRAATEVLRESRATPEQTAYSCDVIDRQVRHLVRLVDDLLDASRISSGKLELRKEEVDLVPIAAGAVESSRPVAARRRQRIDASLPDAPVCVDGDSVRLTQVFRNLLDNALKYSPGGTRVSVAVGVADGCAVARVQDEGSGIADADLPHVFDMFYQGRTRTDDARGGLGVGLALVRQIVDLHGGRVEARSNGADCGSEFLVSLPMLPPQRRAPRRVGGASPRPAMTRRILVVDDNRDAAETIAMMLRLEGNEVDTAYDGESAISATGSFRPDVVLMDIGMPGIGGYEAARAIRRDGNSQGVVLIALTGWGSDFDRKLSRDAGFDRHLVKPVVAQELMSLLSSIESNALGRRSA